MSNKQEGIKYIMNPKFYDSNAIKNIIPNDPYCDGIPYSNFLCDLCENKKNVYPFLYSKQLIVSYAYENDYYYECDYFTYYVLYMWFVEHIMNNEDLDCYLNVKSAYICSDKCYIESDYNNYKKFINNDNNNKQIIMLKDIMKEYCKLDDDCFSYKLLPVSIKYNDMCIIDDYTIAITKVPKFFKPSPNIIFTCNNIK